MIFTSASLHSSRISTRKHLSSCKQLLKLMKQRQIHNFNKATFIIYTSIMCRLFPQSLQYRLKTPVEIFFLYCLTFQLMHLWNEVAYDWSFNRQKAFLDEALKFIRKPQQKLHSSTIWTAQLHTHFPLAGSWARKTHRVQVIYPVFNCKFKC